MGVASATPPPKQPDLTGRSYAGVAAAPAADPFAPDARERKKNFDLTTFKPVGSVVDHNGEKIAVFTPKEKDSLCEVFQYALIGKFSRGRPSMHHLRFMFTEMNLKGRFRLVWINNTHILIHLYAHDDYSRLFMRKVWYFRGFPMRVFKWTPDFNPNQESPISPVWFKVPELPFHLLPVPALYVVAACIGHPLRVDEPTADLTKVTEARVCVEIDITKPIKKSVKVRDGDRFFEQPIVCEGVPPYCQRCCRRNHNSRECKLYDHDDSLESDNLLRGDLRDFLQGKRKGKEVVQGDLDAPSLQAAQTDSLQLLPQETAAVSGSFPKTATQIPVTAAQFPVAAAQNSPAPVQPHGVADFPRNGQVLDVIFGGVSRKDGRLHVDAHTAADTHKNPDHLRADLPISLSSKGVISGLHLDVNMAPCLEQNQEQSNSPPAAVSHEKEVIGGPNGSGFDGRVDPHIPDHVPFCTAANLRELAVINSPPAANLGQQLGMNLDADLVTHSASTSSTSPNHAPVAIDVAGGEMAPHLGFSSQGNTAQDLHNALDQADLGSHCNTQAFESGLDVVVDAIVDRALVRTKKKKKKKRNRAKEHIKSRLQVGSLDFETGNAFEEPGGVTVILEPDQQQNLLGEGAVISATVQPAELLQRGDCNLSESPEGVRVISTTAPQAPREGAVIFETLVGEGAVISETSSQVQRPEFLQGELCTFADLGGDGKVISVPAPENGTMTRDVGVFSSKVRDHINIAGGVAVISELAQNIHRDAAAPNNAHQEDFSPPIPAQKFVDSTEVCTTNADSKDISHYSNASSSPKDILPTRHETSEDHKEFVKSTEALLNRPGPSNDRLLEALVTMRPTKHLRSLSGGCTPQSWCPPRDDLFSARVHNPYVDSDDWTSYHGSDDLDNLKDVFYY